eukprot:scaffold2442_cov146-Cylindrotheca_fusiformis.AAC.10
MSFREPIHILGAGSIGLCWATLIRSAHPSYPVTLLVRNDDGGKKNCTVSLKRLQHPQTTATTLEHISLPIQRISATPPTTPDFIIQNLIVTTKAYQASTAVESVLPRLDKNKSKIVVLCNGALSVKDELSKFDVPLFLATTTHGAYTENGRDQVVHAGIGKTFVEDMPELGHLWDSAGLCCKSLPSKEMNQMLWRKLAANCVINPLTALYQCSNGELLMEPAFPQILQEIVKEVVLVANSSGNVFDSKDANETEEELTSFVYQVIRDTEENKSSMYQDVVMKKQKSEIDHLNGYIVKKGNEAGIDCSANEDIWHRIKELQPAHA